MLVKEALLVKVIDFLEKREFISSTNLNLGNFVFHNDQN